MLGSWNLGKFAGIEVRIHWTFLLLPMWIYFSSLVAGNGAVAASVAVLLILAIFGCVVLHEYGHALTARLFGIPTKDITLLPIGGVARLERMPRSPLQELAIAVAGPAVNVVIAFALFVGLALPGLGSLLPAAVVSFLVNLAWVNVALVVFNMLPAFPMDGGRVLRASLALFVPYATATRAAARVGQIAAVGFAILGLFSGNLMLVLLAAFVFLAAKGEAMMVDRQQAMGGQSPSDAYRARAAYQAEPQTQPRGGYQRPAPLRSLPVVSAAWNARHVLGWVASDAIDEFLVSRGGVVIGIVRKSDLAEVVRAGMGALSMERLLSSHSLPFHDVRRGAPA